MSTMTAVASNPVPETPQHRAAITRRIQSETGLDEATLERLVRAFYSAARHDAEIGSLFDGVADWEAHIAKITAFWSSVALLTGRYHGQPMAAHAPLPLEPQHFRRWLALFEQTARRFCTEQGAAHLMDRAHRIANGLAMGVAVSRGELPSQVGASSIE
ncbi:MAG TPA: group III truncated hemoglobin [Acetobacteraceae bacterium]|nr:group III truncated hemoglobin [Acetobacteraceae bacterium]